MSLSLSLFLFMICFHVGDYVTKWHNKRHLWAYPWTHHHFNNGSTTSSAAESSNAAYMGWMFRYGICWPRHAKNCSRPSLIPAPCITFSCTYIQTRLCDALLFYLSLCCYFCGVVLSYLFFCFFFIT